MCGTGVTSVMLVTSIPQAESARIAASLPEPGPFTITSTVFKPCTSAAFAAVSAAICAAYGVDFLEPLNPRPPALAHDRAFPCASVRVTIVLLKDAWICALPLSVGYGSIAPRESQRPRNRHLKHPQKRILNRVRCVSLSRLFLSL